MSTRNPLITVALLAAILLVSCTKQANMVPANTTGATAKSANSIGIIPIILNFWRQEPNIPLPRASPPPPASPASPSAGLPMC